MAARAGEDGVARQLPPGNILRARNDGYGSQIVTMQDRPSLSPGSPAEREKRRTMSTKLGWAGWAGIGTIVGIFSLIVSILTWLSPPQSPDPNPAPSTGSRSSASTDAASPTAKSVAAAKPAEPFVGDSGKLPELLLGTWQGEMIQPNYRTARYPIKLTFVQPEAGTIIGESRYATQKCEGVLQLTRIDSDSIEFAESITKGAVDLTNNGCAKHVDFTGKFISGNRLYVSASIDGGNSQCAEATLSKL
jgi:hypothetical protein